MSASLLGKPVEAVGTSCALCKIHGENAGNPASCGAYYARTGCLLVGTTMVCARAGPLAPGESWCPCPFGDDCELERPNG